jgi:hypothetical protein
VFLDRKFPVCSIIRPTHTKGAALGAVKALTANGLFRGRSEEFFDVLTKLAREADKARHQTRLARGRERGAGADHME